jgi:hypothetical protein
MLLRKNSQKKSERLSQHELFSSIDDLPQWNWNQIHKTGNYAFLRKQTSYRNIKKEHTESLERLWFEIYNEFIEEFGLSKRYLELLEAKKTIANLKNQYIQTGDRSILNEIEIEEIDFNNEFEKKDEVRFESVVMALEKRQSFSIDPKTITVYKYNNYLRTFKEEENGK